MVMQHDSNSCAQGCNMMRPLVSIVIPVYNGAAYLGEAIDSALAQTCPDTEVVVVNDGSTDDGATEKIALSYGDRIRYFAKENGGVSSALNLGIKKMRGQYFSWLSHDDVYTADKIQSQLELLSDAPDKTMCFCTIRQINAKSAFISGKKKMELADGAILTARQALSYALRHTFNGCSMLVPKAAFDECGGFDEEMRYCQDIFMWWKILLSGYSLAYSDTVGVLSRVHSAQMTGRHMTVYHRDALKIAQEAIPAFAALSDRETNLLYEYAVGEAIHANREPVALCVKAADERKLFTPMQKLRLKRLLLYGVALRPMLRSVYYRTVKRT